RIREQFVVIYLYDERNAVCIFPRHHSQYAEGSSHTVTTAFNGKFYDVFRIKVDRIFREGCSGAVFDTLIDRQNGEITCIGEATRAKQLLQTSQHLRGAVALSVNVIHILRTRKVKAVFRNSFALVLEKKICVFSEDL